MPRRLAIPVLVFTLLGCAAIARVSETSNGAPATSSSYEPGLSTDGRWIVFSSTASNLAGADENTAHDVFVRDQQTKDVELISRTDNGHSANSASDRPSISDDGTRITFRSLASNLVPGDTNGVADIFVGDRATSTVSRISISSTGIEGSDTSDTPRISGDGRFVTFASAANNLVANDTNNRWDVFVRDLTLGTTTLVSRRAAGGFANGDSGFPSISRDGRYVAYRSTASNMVANDTNGVADIFVRDRTAGTTVRVSVTNGGAQAGGASGAPSVSANGRLVAFESVATNLTAGDTNSTTDVFLRDLTAGTTERVSITTGGAQGGGASGQPAVSADGRYVAFESRAPDLVAADTNNTLDVFVRDRVLTTTSRVSTSLWGFQGQGPSGGTPALSGDGRSVAFQSGAPNLTDGDTNLADDILTRSVTAPKITGLTPTSIARGTSATITVRGTGFLPGTIVWVPATGITVDRLTVVSETELTVRVTADFAAPPGATTFWVVLAGIAGGSADLCSCLIVT